MTIRTSWHGFRLWWDVRDDGGELITTFQTWGEADNYVKAVERGLDPARF